MFGIPLFSSLIILYLFLGGAAAGALFFISAWSIYRHRNMSQYSERAQAAFKSLRLYSYIIGLVLLVFSILCLVWDLGYPSRAAYLFLRPHFTVLSFGSYILLFEFLIVLILTGANLFKPIFISGQMRKALEYLCGFFSLAVMIYTGIFLATNASVPFWNTWWLVALFLFSSASAGVSIVLLVDYFIKDRTYLLGAAKPLQKAHIVALILESIALTFFLYAAFENPAASKSVELLMDPSILPVAIIGMVGMGIVVPFCLESFNLTVRPYRAIPVSDVICLFGCFLALRQ